MAEGAFLTRYHWKGRRVISFWKYEVWDNKLLSIQGQHTMGQSPDLSWEEAVREKEIAPYPLLSSYGWTKKTDLKQINRKKIK